VQRFAAPIFAMNADNTGSSIHMCLKRRREHMAAVKDTEVEKQIKMHIVKLTFLQISVDGSRN
jgi:hypothetical protein